MEHPADPTIARAPSTPPSRRLDTGLLVGRDDELVVAQCLSLPAPFVQVQDAPGLGLEVRVSRKDPAPVLPRANGVLVQPPPDRAVADAGHQARALRVSRHVGDAESRQRQTQGRWQLAGERLDLNGDLRGKNPGASRAGSFFQARQSLLEEALAPLADHLAPGVQPRGDLVVGHAARGHQNHLGPNNLEVRRRISGGAAIQLLGLFHRQLDMKRALPWHLQSPVGGLRQNAMIPDISSTATRRETAG